MLHPISAVCRAISRQLYFASQEALIVHRHSEATEVHLALEQGISSEIGSIIALTIRDNGKGMPLSIVEASEAGRHLVDVPTIGIGLAGMRERLHQFGGSLQIGSGSQGTTVHVTVPLLASDETQIEKALRPLPKWSRSREPDRGVARWRLPYIR
jgi:signal transduction histidine kinase